MPGAVHPLEPWPVDQPLPSMLTDHDLMRVVQLRKAAFYEHKALGAFRRLEVKGVAVGATRYSGALVQRLREGAPIARFGRKKAS